MDPEDEILEGYKVKDTPPEGGTPPAPVEPPVPGTPPEGGVPPAPVEPPAPGTPPEEKKVSEEDILKVRNDFAKEILGDRFTSLDDIKTLNIPDVLSEVENLRKSNTELSDKLAKKPKTAFVNDSIAKFNEFVKETGINNYGVFLKLDNNEKLQDIDSMDALVTQYIVKNPNMTGKEIQIRRMLERKYNIISNPTEEQKEEPGFADQQEDNKLMMESDANQAKQYLLEMKGKIKMPELEKEPDPPKEKTPEEIAKFQQDWSNVGTVMGQKLGKLEIPIKDKQEPFMSYELSEDEKKVIANNVTEYAVKNNIELNDANVGALADIMYGRMIVSKLPEIVFSVFEKTSKMTEQETKALFYHPSAEETKNKDLPPTPPEQKLSPQEQSRKDAYYMEMED